MRWLALLAFLLAPSLAHAQATVVTSCGSTTLTAGTSHFVTVDTNGQSCQHGAGALVREAPQTPKSDQPPNGAKMMKPLSLAFLVALGAIPAAAQQANVVTACGSMAPFGALTAGGQSFPTVDVNGNLCLSGGGSGGGGITSITAGTTPTTGFTAGQLLMSNGTVTQASGNPDAALAYSR